MPYTVEANSLCKSFGGHLVLDHVDLAIEPGRVLGLLGPNGAGKTTLVRILATLLKPDAGTATVAGHKVVGDPVAVKRSISLTGQFAAVDDVLTGRENLEMMAKLLHVPRREMGATVTRLLDSFDLADGANRRAGTYSGGMRRRLDLAISMITRPTVLFLDEPTTGLDPRSREQLWSTVRRLQSEGVTVLLTTQYLEEADQLADEVMLLDHGRIVAQGTADELKAELGGETLRLQFADSQSLSRAATLVGAGRLDERLCLLEVATNGTADAVLSTLTALEQAGLPATKLSLQRPSLDDVFISLTNDKEPAPCA
jgi:ABC-2 type transport system ATP-binding protein